VLRRTLTYDDMTRRMLVVLGDGNESKGVRVAARLAWPLRKAATPCTPTDESDVPGSTPAPGPLSQLDDPPA
jgi:hypothetical protein